VLVRRSSATAPGPSRQRLQANIPVTLLIVFLFLLVILMRNSIPYFAGLALTAYNDSGFSTIPFLVGARARF
jgi:hypothetical protein